MKWQLMGDWPVGQWLVPWGTILEAPARDGEIVETPRWNGIPLPRPMPIDAMALDDDAALAMRTWYGPESYDGDQRHRLRFGPDVDLAAVDAILTGKGKGLSRHHRSR